MNPCDTGLTCLFCYFGCESSSCGIGESYTFIVLTSTVGAVCAANVGGGCVRVCTYVRMYISRSRRDAVVQQQSSKYNKSWLQSGLCFLASWGSWRVLRVLLGAQETPLALPCTQHSCGPPGVAPEPTAMATVSFSRVGCPSLGALPSRSPEPR